MTRVDNLGSGEFARIKERLHALEMATPLSHASVGRGRLRMYDGSVLLIEDGNLSVTGTATIAGLLNGSGTLTWTGTSNLNGPVVIDGATTLNNNLTLGTGKIIAGPVTIDKLGTASGRIWSSGQMVIDGTSIYLGASTTVSGPLGVSGDTNISGNIHVSGNSTVDGSKLFRMEHPTKPGHWIQHGSTESPISGTEYTGTDTFDAVGKCVVTLPDYFEALNKPENRTVQLTAVGRPFMVGADRIKNGKFIAYGQAGREFDWNVKAERFGGDFEIEPTKENE